MTTHFSSDPSGWSQLFYARLTHLRKSLSNIYLLRKSLQSPVTATTIQIYFDFKNMNFIREKPNIVLSQKTLNATKYDSQPNDRSATEIGFQRELMDKEVAPHCTVAGWHAWTRNGTTFTSVCMAIMAFQVKKESVAQLNSCQGALAKVFKK